MPYVPRPVPRHQVQENETGQILKKGEEGALRAVRSRAVPSGRCGSPGQVSPVGQRLRSPSDGVRVRLRWEVVSQFYSVSLPPIKTVLSDT